jgi:RES domain-containing protein
LAILDKLVSIDIAILPDDLCISALEIPKSKILKIPEEELPKNWNHYPSPDVLKSISKSWIELSDFCTLQIPSVVNPMESNYHINVKHPLMEKIKIIEVTLFV